jgi:hypothetical protein
MHNPELNPATCRTLNGKMRRYANGTFATRHVRLDSEADRNLAYLQRVLTGDDPRDVASISLVCRRALEIFRKYVSSLEDRPSLQTERQKVRERSHVPRIRKPSSPENLVRTNGPG